MGTVASPPSSKPKCSFVRRKRPGWNRCEGSIVTPKRVAGDSGRAPTTDNVWRADAPSRDPGRTLVQTSRGASLSSKGVQMSSLGTRTCLSLFNPIATIGVNSNNAKVPDTHSSRARYWEGSVVVVVNHLSVTCKVNQVNCTTVRLGLTTATCAASASPSGISPCFANHCGCRIAGLKLPTNTIDALSASVTAAAINPPLAPRGLRRLDDRHAPRTAVLHEPTLPAHSPAYSPPPAGTPLRPAPLGPAPGSP